MSVMAWIYDIISKFYFWELMMTRIIIDNVKEEYIPAFRDFAEKMNATLSAESDICEFGYSHEPNDETIKALQECEAGGNGKVYASYSDFVKEIEKELADETKS
ncbi:hypothetical protein ACWIUD_04415 [Helicobacter sp. 23-1044]